VTGNFVFTEDLTSPIDEHDRLTIELHSCCLATACVLGVPSSVSLITTALRPHASHCGDPETVESLSTMIPMGHRYELICKWNAPDHWTIMTIKADLPVDCDDTVPHNINIRV
jgi:hypothetical protein